MKRLAVLVSGRGSNLEAIRMFFANRGPDAAATVALVATDRAGVAALDRANRWDIPTDVILSRGCDADHLTSILSKHRIDLVILAGYLRLVPAAVVARFRGRMVNIHPALLPSFGGKGMYGRAAHSAVIRARICVSGATIHFVDATYDTGPIIAQCHVPVHENDDAAALAARVLEAEHVLYPRVIEALALGHVFLDDRGRSCWLTPPELLLGFAAVNYGTGTGAFPRPLSCAGSESD